jgi:anaerobic magnesium-protoporphyrin IX monomethyl ester cyclase
MRVFFLYPSAESQLGFNYGVAHLASLLKQAGHHVAFWQLCEEIEPLPTEQQFLDRIAREKPDVLAFSVVTNQWAYAKKLASWARPRFSIPFVIGGVHTLMSVEEVLETGLFDFAFRGECEDPFLKFIERLDRKESVESVPNLAYVRNSRIQINPVGPLPELTRLPLKDYESMDFQRLIDAKNGWVGLMASRGCPFSCTYCFNHVMVETYKQDLQCSFKGLHYIRRFSVEQMIEEIEYLRKHYRNIRMFIFDDECAMALAEAGCKIVKFGVESGSETVRRTILNRHMSNDSIVEAMATVQRHGMHSSVFIIIGFPHEGSDDVFDTIRLLGRAKPGRFRWTFFFPFPGTKSHQISLDGGYINAEKMERLRNFTDESCLDFDPEHNLLLKKIGRIMPWFVNAYSDLPVAGFYRDKVEEILAMDETQWDRICGSLLDRDKEYSQEHGRHGLSHYAVKYNRFMGVISDYFLSDA